MKSNLALAIFLAMISNMLTPGMAAANARDDVLAGAVRCRAITDDRAWLDCYYGAAQPMRSHFGLAPALEFQIRLVPAPTAAGPAPRVAAPPQTAAPRNNNGGFMGALFGGATLIDRMPLSSYGFDKKGLVTVTLADGEVWQQLADDDSFARWHGPAARYVITIKQGSLGSANLAVQGESETYKVRRIR